jgi:hypothetical protein
MISSKLQELARCPEQRLGSFVSSGDMYFESRKSETRQVLITPLWIGEAAGIAALAVYHKMKTNLSPTWQR